MAYVQPCPGGIGEHVHDVSLRGARTRVIGVVERPGGVGRVEGAVLLPVVLPPRLDLTRQAGGVPERWNVGLAVRSCGPGCLAHIATSSCRVRTYLGKTR